jgi:hypothetical protein
MNRILVAPFLTLLSLSAMADDRRALVGVWRYDSEVDTRVDGSPAPASALSETHGLLVYTSDGFVSVVLMPKNRTWLSEAASIAELRETVTNGTAYAGRYELNPSAHTITHITSVGMEPVTEGKRLVRNYALDGNTLKLTGTFPYDGESIYFTITWTRVSGSHK